MSNAAGETAGTNATGGLLCLDRCFGQGTRTTSCPGYPQSLAFLFFENQRARRAECEGYLSL